MKIVQKIWSELSAQPKKVELATMKDLDRVTEALSTARTRVNQELQDLASMMGKIEVRADEADKFAMKTDKMIIAAEGTMRELINQAKDLGINPNELKEVKEFLNQRDMVNELINDLRALITKAI
jgi:methylaspartate ammonia-lyase|tara:strand:+ start:3513 stop:3887 length:375 start_codon:yes stop_codon:yes gene_type:complete